MTQIEQGCKAVIVGGKDEALLGKTVVVGKFIGIQYIHTDDGDFQSNDKDLFEIDMAVQVYDSGAEEWTDFTTNAFPAKWLRRIDDHTPDTDDEIVYNTKKPREVVNIVIQLPGIIRPLNVNIKWSTDA